MVERNGHVFGKAIEDKIQGFHPHSDGSENLARVLVNVNTLLDAILASEVTIEIDLGFSNDLEVGIDNESCSGVSGLVLSR